MSDSSFVCPVCGNKDLKYTGIRNGKRYCRKCISFNNNAIEECPSFPKQASIFINYNLSLEQQELSDKLLLNYKQGINSLVNAVCGSGKTEIVLQVISYVIRSGEKVAFAVPRRDVAIELCDRFKAIFKYNKVICVYGGHHDEVEADLLVLTTHQLYRYKDYFNLLILDEIDAFPYSGNEVLESLFYRSIKGNYIMLSATPDKKIIDYFSKPGFDILSLNRRFHNHFLPVPEIILAKKFLLYYKLYKYLNVFLKETKQVFIFCPTIDICENTYKFLKLFFKHGACVHSKCKNRNEIIENFKVKKYKYLVTTAVLERGVTVKDLQVIVFLAMNKIYTSAALIQIAGRAGRKKDAPEGRVIFITNEITKDIEESVRKIQFANSDM